MVHLHHPHHSQHRHHHHHHNGYFKALTDSKVEASPEKPSIPCDVDNPPFYLPLWSFNDRYCVISNLGNGSFGSVSLAKINVDLNDASNFKIFRKTLLERNDTFVNENFDNKRAGIVAIKTMNKRLETLHDYTKVKEIKFILSMPYHKNLVQIYELFIDNIEFKLHIAMECLDQNLYQLMKARRNNYFSQSTLKFILSQILNGIRHIHRNDYFHRDLKPENILVSPTNVFYHREYLKSDTIEFPGYFVVKIADYGLARHVENRRPYTTYVSTRWYRAPEILLRKSWYSRPVDIWAFGSVAAEVVTFTPLFPGSDELSQIWKVLEFLGTPLSRNGLENYYPSYGYWDEALFLASQFGLSFPQRRCIDIQQVISNPDLRPLCDVIRICLSWNPNTRADIEKVCSMPYFKNTCLDSSNDSVSTFKTQTNFKQTNLEKSERLAGIPPQLKKQHQNFESTIESYGSSPQEVCDVNLSFLNDGKSSYYTSNLNEYIYNSRLQEDLSPPKLTSSIQTNDENMNSFNDGILSNQKQFKQNFHQVPNWDIVSIQSSEDCDNLSSSIIQNNKLALKTLYERDPILSKKNATKLSYTNNEICLPNDEVSEFIDWNKFESDANDDHYETSATNKANLNTDDLMTCNVSSEDDILMSFYDKQHANIAIDNSSIHPLIPSDIITEENYSFSDELYSKFNLHQLKDESISNNNSYLVGYEDSFETSYN